MERVVSVCVTRGQRAQWKKEEDRPGDSGGFLGEARHQSRQGTAFQIRTDGTAAAATLPIIREHIAFVP